MATGRSNEFVTSLRQVDLNSRSLLILDRLRLEIAVACHAQFEAIPRDSTIPKTRYGENMVAVTGQTLLILQSAIKRSLGMHVYPRELAAVDTLRHLAEYLAREIEEPSAHTEFTETSPASRDWDCPWIGDPNAAKLQKLVFVLSSPRAGSTLFRVMLEGHPNLFAPPELNLLPFETMGRRSRWFREHGCEWLARGLVTAVSSLWQAESHKVEQHVRDWERNDAPVLDVYRWLHDAAAPRILVDKSPFYALYRNCMLPAIQCCPSARYIHLIRHPTSVIESLVRMRFHRLYGPGWPGFHPSPWKYSENLWRHSVEHVLDFLQHVPAAHRRTLRFEGLVSDPRAAASGICEFLGVDFDQAVLTPYEGNRMTHHGTPASRTLGDPNFLEHRSIEPDRGNAWSEIRLPISLEPATKRVAAIFGYDLA